MWRRTAWLVLGLLLACASKTANQRLVEELQAHNLETRVDERGITVFVADVLFAFDSAELTPEGQKQVARIAEIAGRVAPGRALVAEGHTDAMGPESYNLDLSLRRATTVADALSQAGIARGLLSVKGFGETRPLAPETSAAGKDDPKGRQRNRRVELIIANP